MEWRLSSRWRPRPEEQFAWGSQSTRRTLRPSRARQAARLMAVVVLPTPPFWLTMPRILTMGFQSKGKGGLRIATGAVENRAKLWKASGAVWGEKLANSCRGRVSRRSAWRLLRGRQKGGSVENFRDFGAENPS